MIGARKIPFNISRYIPEDFQTQYKRIVDRCHELGMDVRFHTDGKITTLFRTLLN